MSGGRQPNHRLRGALDQAGWSGQQLANAVNRAGHEIGVTLSYDRTAVAHWLGGTQPRPPAAGLLAEVFSRRLGYPVSPVDLGLGPVTARAVSASGTRGLLPPPAGALAHDLPRLENVVTALGELAGSHATARRHATAQPAYSLAALDVPRWAPGGIGISPRVPAPRGAAGDVTAADVEAAGRMARLFGACDAALGGGSVRQAAALYLARELAPKLTAPARHPRRRRLLTTSAEITYLCASTCFDDELQGLAQQYYRAALRLAAENGDEAVYAITLRGMSAQAGSLGHRSQARRLAEAAASSVRRVAPVRQAFLLGQLAVASAADGDRTGALSSLAEAERRLERATSESPLIGAYHPAALAHQRAAVQALLGDTHGAIATLSVSLRHRPLTERRDRAITLATLAEFQLSVGHLDEAIQTWNSFLDDYPYLRSGRVTTALRVLRRSVRPHTRNPNARTLLQRANSRGRALLRAARRYAGIGGHAGFAAWGGCVEAGAGQRALGSRLIR